MTIETQVFSTLNALAPAGGVWANVANDTPTTPYIVFARISAVPNNVLDGSAPALTRVRVQVDCVDGTYEGAKALAESVKSAMLAAPFKNLLDTDQDLYDPEVKLHRVTIDFFCWQ